MNNLLKNLPVQLAEELSEVLAESSQVRIERIVSTGQASPPGFWYDQSEHEWVAVLQGTAVLRFEDNDQSLSLRRGDHLLIPAGRKHRVDATSAEEPTVWLAVFFAAEEVPT